jgi:hypothetical protein
VLRAALAWLAAALAPVLAQAAFPADAHAQSVLDLLRSIEQGGGWVSIPVQEGKGSLETRPMPTGGMTLRGCMQIYAGMSGQWDLEARDVLGEGHLRASVTGGESVPFSYRTGARGQLRVEARWSERRDTTLLVWVGLGAAGGPGRDPCEPVYGGDAEETSASEAVPEGG